MKVRVYQCERCKIILWANLDSCENCGQEFRYERGYGIPPFAEHLRVIEYEVQE